MTESTALKIEESSEIEIEVFATEDAMQVLLTCNSTALESEDFYDLVLEQLKSLKVTCSPDRVDFVAKIAKLKKAGATELIQQPIAEGVPPILPEDGRTEWSKDYFNTHYVVDPETGRIDFTRRVGDPSVKEGDLLVWVHPAKPGKPGTNVFGEPLPVAKPIDERPLPGLNVYWDEGASGFRAQCDGRISRDGRTIKVDNVFEIKTCIGGTTGSIDHNGTVVVHGDIEDQYVLKATEDIEIRGTVYECNITCGGNLAAMGGISSNHNGIIEVQGEAQARYVNQATLHSVGRITVEKELYQSITTTNADVTCRTGRIVGGTTTAVAGITVGEAGSKGSPRTALILEADLNIRNRIRAARKEIEEAQSELPDLYDQLRALQRQADTLGAAGAKKIAQIEGDAQGAERRVSDATTEIDTLIARQRGDNRARIVIRDRVFPGVVIQIFDEKRLIDKEIEGPMVARLNWDKMEIELVSGTD